MSMLAALDELDTATEKDKKTKPQRDPLDSAALTFSQLYEDDTGRLGKRHSRCADVLGDLHPGQTKHVVSMGEWSADNMIAWTVDQIGPSDLLFGTWSLSVKPAARLCAAADAGLLTSFRGVFDLRAVIRRPEAMRMIRARFGYSNVRIFNCHAKVYLLSNADRRVSIVSSANFTNNPRIEASVITDDPAVFAFHHDWIERTFNKSDPFEPKECEVKPDAPDCED